MHLFIYLFYLFIYLFIYVPIYLSIAWMPFIWIFVNKLILVKLFHAH